MRRITRSDRPLADAGSPKAAHRAVPPVVLLGVLLIGLLSSG